MAFLVKSSGNKVKPKKRWEEKSNRGRRHGRRKPENRRYSRDQRRNSRGGYSKDQRRPHDTLPEEAIIGIKMVGTIISYNKPQKKNKQITISLKQGLQEYSSGNSKIRQFGHYSRSTRDD